MIVHKDYKVTESEKTYHDIALIRFDTTFDVEKAYGTGANLFRMLPICLPTKKFKDDEKVGASFLMS